MKSKSKRVLSTLLAFALAFGMFAAMPLTVSAADANALKTTIESFDHGGAGSLSAQVSTIFGVSTVTVTGAVTGATKFLSLNIDSNVTVIWNASYQGSTASTPLILLNGNGTFEVKNGSVMQTGTSEAIQVNGYNTVKVSGGMVTANRNRAIYSVSRPVEVSGGVVASFGNSAISSGNTSVSGGLVFGVGTALSSSGTGSVIRHSLSGSTELGGEAVVCGWNKPDQAPTYPDGASAALIFNSGSTVTWSNISSQSGISYVKGSNTGFLPVNDVTVTVRSATISPTAVAFDKITGGDISVTVDLAGHTPVAIKNGSYTLQLGSDFTISGDIVTLRADYLRTLAPGTHSIVFQFNAGVFPVLTVSVTASSGDMSNFKKTRTYAPGMFSDVNENAWYGFAQQKVVANAYEYNLMQGSGNTFNAMGKMRLNEALAIAARVHHIYKGGDGVFTQGSPWYQVYVDYAISNDIINSGTFSDYNKAATRAEMAYIFSRALPVTEFASQNTVNSLPDVNNSTPYRDAIFMLYRAGVVEGSGSNGAFNPGGNIRRVDASAIISRVILPATRMSGRTF